MASTGRPLPAAGRGSPSATVGRPSGVDLQHGDVGGVAAQHLGGELAYRSLNGFTVTSGFAHHVALVQDQPVGADDEARALAAERLRASAVCAGLHAAEETEEGSAPNASVVAACGGVVQARRR